MIIMLKNKPGKLKLILLIAIIFTISGCALNPYAGRSSIVDSAADHRWKQHKKKLKKIKQFNVSGSLAYFSNKTKSYARFNLIQKNNDNYKLILTSPLGSSFMTLTVNDNKAMLQLPKNKIYYSNHVEKLLKNITGISIPLESLHAWLLGLSTNLADEITENGYLKKTVLTQKNDTWQLTILAYYDDTPIALPAKMELTRTQERIKFTISKWTL